MDVTMRMPDLATTDSSMTIVRWLVEVGQPVRRGQTLLEVETDKAAMDVESVVTGILRSVLAPAGDLVVAGQAIAVFEADAAESRTGIPESGATGGLPTSVQGADALVGKPPVAPEPSPVVLDLQPSGPERTSFFARNRAARASRAPDTEVVVLSVARRTLARRMSESQREVPHFYLQASANVAPAAARRAASAAAGRPIAWDAVFVHAVGLALKRFPRMAYRYDDGRLIPRGNDTVNVAADLDDELFAVGVERPAEQALEEITEAIRAGVARLRGGDPRARVTPAAGLTISNLGSTGVEAFAAVINPPETAVLAVGAARPVVVAVDGQPVVQTRATLTLSADHRVVNGKYAAGFLGAVVAAIESIGVGEG